mmetsp:Transcript_10089/g.13750  ORF Transcript_10089/g.13750 Transcript_10089/m.13750 type:complete len:268 (-) Transcript_10089:422-1225(-)|eukprot:CAMPEP_0196570552 /NCGR_PEP_ID=MMETSP1081-20130531/685_1 /TAXON_ID=36882 /ORGANISM="Pyramimonas amylifera, Strain CCMP720" /LENGTH=267 /DNA_ID=CAMNT_0041887065 /DNA_START=844 /DNA_END=1647 /DNA_ORIENTATION=+
MTSLIYIPMANLEAYNLSVRSNPVFTQACTSCFAYGLGDFIAQLIQRREIRHIQMDRVARSAFAGFFIHGPFCHYWIEWTETYLDFNHAWWNFIPKVIGDQTVWSFFLNSAYTTTILSLQGIPATKVKEEIEETWFQVLCAGWKFWPFVHCITFSPLIPVDYKILFVDAVEIIWVVVLSTVINKDSDKKKQCLIGDAAEFSSPDADVMIAAKLEREICLQDEDGDMFCFPPEDGCSEVDGGDLFCTLPFVQETNEVVQQNPIKSETK